jgi:5-methylcytosine-specific restriction endonuclease McrA
MAVAHKKVLVLNKSWMAINTSTVRHAVSLMFAGQARGILISDNKIQALNWEEWTNITVSEEEEAIKTVTQKIKLPSIVVMNFCDKIPKQIIKFTQNNLWERDNFTCQYTGKKVTRQTGNIDHIIPKSLGGKTCWENCVIACKDINAQKSDKTPEQAGLKLIKKPTRPRIMPVSFFIKNKEKNLDWNWFLHS